MSTDRESLCFQRVYSSYFAFTWRSLRHLGVPEPLLEDAAQELWLVVSRRLPSFEGRSQIRTWLFGIALNVKRNLRRAESRRPPHVPLSVELPAGGLDPSHSSERAEAWRLVSDFLDTLDETRREVFVGALIEGCSAAELSRVLPLEMRDIQNRVRALRRSFERWLARQEEGG